MGRKNLDHPINTPLRSPHKHSLTFHHIPNFWTFLTFSGTFCPSHPLATLSHVARQVLSMQPLIPFLVTTLCWRYTETRIVGAYGPFPKMTAMAYFKGICCYFIALVGLEY